MGSGDVAGRVADILDAMGADAGEVRETLRSAMPHVNVDNFIVRRAALSTYVNAALENAGEQRQRISFTHNLAIVGVAEDAATLRLPDPVRRMLWGPTP